MDLLGVLRVTARRWYVLLPILALCVIGSWAVSRQVAPTYEVQAILPLTTPYVGSDEAASSLAGNGFTDLVTTASMMAAIGDSPDVREEVEESNGNSEYEIGADGALVSVIISGETPQTAFQTYNALREALDRRLAALQEAAGVPTGFRVVFSDAVTPGLAKQTVGSRQRALIASLGLGVILSLATSVLADHVLSRRRIGPFQIPINAKGVGNRDGKYIEDDESAADPAPTEAQYDSTERRNGHDLPYIPDERAYR